VARRRPGPGRVRRTRRLAEERVDQSPPEPSLPDEPESFEPESEPESEPDDSELSPELDGAGAIVIVGASPSSGADGVAGATAVSPVPELSSPELPLPEGPVPDPSPPELCLPEDPFPDDSPEPDPEPRESDSAESSEPAPEWPEPEPLEPECSSEPSEPEPPEPEPPDPAPCEFEPLRCPRRERWLDDLLAAGVRPA
jgi:hypothetical protein